MNFYKKVDIQSSKLIVKNDVRKLENTLKRLMVHKDTSYTWKNQDKDFIILALDTTNIEWLESRITKRIKEMVCEEYGLQETFGLLLTISVDLVS